MSNNPIPTHKELISAICNDDCERVENMLREGADLYANKGQAFEWAEFYYKQSNNPAMKDLLAKWDQKLKQQRAATPQASCSLPAPAPSPVMPSISAVGFAPPPAQPPGWPNPAPAPSPAQSDIILTEDEPVEHTLSDREQEELLKQIHASKEQKRKFTRPKNMGRSWEK